MALYFTVIYLQNNKETRQVFTPKHEKLILVFECGSLRSTTAFEHTKQFVNTQMRRKGLCHSIAVIVHSVSVRRTNDDVIL